MSRSPDSNLMGVRWFRDRDPIQPSIEAASKGRIVMDIRNRLVVRDLLVEDEALYRLVANHDQHYVLFHCCLITAATLDIK